MNKDSKRKSLWHSRKNSVSQLISGGIIFKGKLWQIWKSRQQESPVTVTLLLPADEDVLSVGATQISTSGLYTLALASSTVSSKFLFHKKKKT